MELKGKTAIVTGSSKGIGAGIALAFGREGANVVVNSRKAADGADMVRQIEAAGGNAIAVGADVSKKAEVEAMVAACVKQFGTVDILVNNAGIEAMPALLKDIPEEQWDRLMTVNLKSVFLCCQAVIPVMMEQNKGKIINISSLAGRRMTFFGSADYTAAKHGVCGLTYHLAWELADSHITVNAICPGAIMTPLMEEGTTPEYREMVVKRLIPLGRFGTTADIAQAAIFFGSDRSDWITGQLMDVDGGTMTGYGEDLRPLIRKRMAEAKAKAEAKAAAKAAGQK